MEINKVFFFCVIIFFENSFAATLHDLVQEGCCEQLQQYLEHELGCNLNEVDEMGKTALYHACKKGNLDMVKYLYHMGASLHSIDLDCNNTLLHCACMFNHHDIVMFLLRKGVNPLHLNIYKHTPYDLLRSDIKKEHNNMFNDAIYWKNEFKNKSALDNFLFGLEQYETSTRHAERVRLGFLLAYNQGMVRFFEKIYQEGKTEQHDIFEIIIGSEKSLTSKKEYQTFLVKKALKEKNHEFVAAALNADWDYDKNCWQNYMPDFSRYQKDMVTKVLIGKSMLHFQGDIYFVQ